jgi:hypothetical protein
MSVERRQLEGTLPSWWEIKDGSDTGCQNNNGALTVRCVVLLSVFVFVCMSLFCSLLLLFLSFLPNRALQYFSPPPCYIRFFCLSDGTSTRPLHGYVLGGKSGAMPKMDGTTGTWTFETLLRLLGSCTSQQIDEKARTQQI